MEHRPSKDPEIHYFGKKRLCVTGGLARKLSPERIVVGTKGFIPLWEKDVKLRYRFNERTLRESKRPKEEIVKVLNEAIKQWGDAAPVTFMEDGDLWDFEIHVRNASDSPSLGGGQQTLELYPTMFENPIEDQVETLVHELGHVFGLRHWFAKEEDAKGGWRSEVFGHNDPLTIMNYGEKSKLTENDKQDLKLLYTQVWSGELKAINSTPIVLFKPFSAHSPAAAKK
ncbi:hypothetical protein BGZ72_005549 [Mortierella alpina]|nr:hypothetical protein BGZ72_005549 [Mortierella alpina]